MILAAGKSSTRVIPSVTSARYSPGPGTIVSSRASALPLDTPANSCPQDQKNSVSLLQSRKSYSCTIRGRGSVWLSLATSGTRNSKPAAIMDQYQRYRTATGRCRPDSGVTAEPAQHHSSGTHRGLERVPATQLNDVSKPAGRDRSHPRAWCGAFRCCRSGGISHYISEGAVL